MSPFLLRRIYRDHGISYRNAQVVSRRAMEQANYLRDLRMRFAILLQNLLEKGEDIIYIDESQAHSWMMPRKSWSTELEPVYHV